MATWQVKSSDGRSWTIEAPDSIPESEVIEYADEHADSWVNGGRYRLTEDGMEAPASQPGKAEPSSRNKAAAATVARLDEQIAALESQIAATPSREIGVTPGGAATGMRQSRIAKSNQADLTADLDELKAQRSKLVVGTTGQTVGGMGGAFAGAGAGLALGSLAGPPGMAIGGIVGSILGGAAGAAAGTHLKDIPDAQEALDISDEEAAQLIRSRAIESLLWDGAFVLILGPGGRVIGKMLNGQRMLPALKASAKESIAWDKIAGSKEAQLESIAAKRAAAAPPGIATEVSTPLGVPAAMPDKKATAQLVLDVARRSGGRIPTQGEMRGLVEGGERFARTQSPMRFFKNDQVLADTAEQIRRTALGDLDAAGAYGSIELGDAIGRVTDSANKTLKSTAGKVFERAAEQRVVVNMTAPLKYLDNVLFRDTESAGSLLAGPERQRLTALRDALKEEPFMTAQGTQDFISGQKAALRASAPDGTRPGEYMSKIVGDLVEQADNAYLGSLKEVGDPTLVKDLLDTRKLYRETMKDLYSDTMADVARKTPEDIGKSLTGKGTITEIRELRKALDRAVSNAPEKGRARIIKEGAVPRMTELSREALIRERAQIDAGMMKGFLERNTQSLDDLPNKLRDPDFRATLKELLLGDGAADPALGQKVLGELDRLVGVVKLIKPEMAPQPGRVPVPGMGGTGTGTIVGGLTGQGIGPGTIMTIITTLSGIRSVAGMMATAMTTGNTGALRTLQRAISLAPAAGKNAAAAEALLSTLRELDVWDKQNGGSGIPDLPPAPQPKQRTKSGGELVPSFVRG